MKSLSTLPATTLFVAVVAAIALSVARPASAVIVESGGGTVFYENYEDDNNGAQPTIGGSNIGSYPSGGTNGLTLVTNSASPGAYEGSKYLNVARPGAFSGLVLNEFTSAVTSGTLTAKFAVYVPSSAAVNTVGIILTPTLETSTGDTLDAPVLLYTDTSQVYTYTSFGDSGYNTTFVPFAKDVWQIWQIDYFFVAGLNNDKFVLTIDGNSSLPIDAGGYHQVADPSGLRYLNFRAAANASNFYVDTLLPEPTAATTLIVCATVAGLARRRWLGTSMKKVSTHPMIALLVVTMIMYVACPASAVMLVDYKFDEASSGITTALNSGTNGAAYNAGFQGTATRSSDTPASHTLGSADLNGVSTDRILPAPDKNLGNLTQFTVTAWLKVQTQPGGFQPFVSNIDASNEGWFFYVVPDGSLQRLGVEVNNTANTSSSTIDALNKWVFVAATWDGSLAINNTKFYAETETSAVTLIGTITLDSSMNITSNPQFKLGGYKVGNSFNVPNALLDDVRVYGGTTADPNDIKDAAALDAIRLENLPEPTSLGLLALGGLLLGRSSRRPR